MRINELQPQRLDEGIGVHNDDFDLYLSMYLDSASSLTINLNTRSIGAVTDDPGEDSLWIRKEFRDLMKKSKDNPALERAVEAAYDQINTIREAAGARAQTKMSELTVAFVTMLKAILIEEKQAGAKQVESLLQDLSRVE